MRIIPHYAQLNIDPCHALAPSNHDVNQRYSRPVTRNDIARLYGMLEEAILPCYNQYQVP